MKQWIFLLSGLCVLSACKPEAPHVQTQLPTASDVVQEASKPENTAASAIPAVAESASPPAVAASSPLAASAASAANANMPLHKSKKIPISNVEEFGNIIYYFPDSIKKVGNLYYVMTESRFREPQTLPETNKEFLYSLIKEAVDCKNKLTDPISVSHFSAKDELLRTDNYDYPDYTTWSKLELEALANEHPDAAFISAVCKQAQSK